jgi:hypothetical protein
MFRGATRNLSLRQKLVILASVGVLLPIGVLTYMQYRSLTDLQNKTKGAFKDNLRQGLTIVEQRMKQRLEDIAAQTLKPVDSLQLSSPARTEEVERYLAGVKSSHPQIDEIFVFDYSSDQKAASTFAYIYSDTFVRVARTQLTPQQRRILFLFDKGLTEQSFLDDKRTYLFAHDVGVKGFYLFSSGNIYFLPIRQIKSPVR